MFDFELTGVENAIAAVRRAVTPVNDQRIGENAGKALEPVAEEARRLAPVRSGTLRDSIVVSTQLGGYSTDARVVYVGPLTAGGSDAFYAHFIEFGTVTMRAEPFMAPAVFKHRDLVFEVLGLKIGQDMIGAI